MKAKLFFTSALAVAFTLSFSSCSQNGGYDTAGYDTATPIADGEIPPWIAENSDPAYESGGYNKVDEDKLAYNPPAKPKVNKSSGKKGSKAKGKSKSSGSKARTYKVKKGDTLGAIARRYGTSVKAIKRANGLKSDMIYVNQKLTIPRK